MRRYEAVVIKGAGGPEVLELGTVEVRDPGFGEVRVEVAAAGLNRADLLQRKGLYPAPPGVPADVPGLEFAGVVESVGEGVDLFKAGDRVMGIVGGGAMARAVTVHARELIPVPPELTLADAAAIPEAFLTAWDALVAQAHMSSGEYVLIHAAASGVGTAALQIADLLGARAIGTTRSAGKVGRLKELGAERAVLASGGPEEVAEHVLEFAPKGVDVVLDLVGGPYLEQALKLSAERGRIVLVGLLGGREASLDLGELLRRRITVRGTVLRPRPLEEKIAVAQAFVRHLLPAFEAGRLRPVVAEILPMVEVAAAHELMAKSEHVGKIVLAW